MFRQYFVVKSNDEPVFILSLDSMGLMDIHNYPKGVTMEEIDKPRFDELNKQYKTQWNGQD